MKKNIVFIIFAAVIISLSFSACKTVSYEARGIGIENQNIISTPTVVDIQVDLNKRVTYKDEHFVNYGNILQAESKALEAARYACIMKDGIDVVVDPVYKFTVRGKKAKIELTGYAGYYRNPRTIYEDVNSFVKYSMDDVKKYILFNNPSLIKSEGAPVNITFPSEK